MSDVLQKSAESRKSRGHLDPSGFNKHILFHTYVPPEDLRPFIEHFWTLSWDESASTYNSEQVMHRPHVDVFMSKDWSGIQGTFRDKRTYVAAGSGRIIGIRFLPGAFHRFWNGDMGDLQNKVLDIHHFFPSMDSKQIESLLAITDEMAIAQLLPLLRAKLPRVDPNIALINDIINSAEDNTQNTVSAIASNYGKSERWLQQLFQEYVGIGLKWFLQRHKLLYAATQIRQSAAPDWAAIAYEAGYSSQQHFITDFKKTTGKTPLQYKNNLHDTQANHQPDA